MKVLNSEYSVSYTNSPNLEDLDSSEPGKYIKLTFSRKLYKGLLLLILFIIAFAPDGIIRRITAFPTSGGREIVIDLTAVKFNVGILDSKFKYDPQNLQIR